MDQLLYQEHGLLCNLPIAGEGRWYIDHAFPKNISVKWNAKSFVQDLNSVRRIQPLKR